MARAFAYLRVSTRTQDVEAQRAQITKFAGSHGFEILEWFSDPFVSGKIPPLERAGFSEMYHAIQRLHPDNILVYEISRLGRDFWEILKVIEVLEEICPVISTSDRESFLQTSDRSMREIFLAILSWVAGRERALLSQRTKDALEFAREQGRFGGRKALGFDRIEGRLTPDELGRRALELYYANESITPKDLSASFGLKYKSAWLLLNNVKRFVRQSENSKPSMFNS